MRWLRLFRHLLLPRWWVLRVFPRATLRLVEQAVKDSESRHRGELRFVVEAGLPLPGLLRGQSPRARAIDLFAQLRVWDTEENSGVLIYLQLIDRRVEIVADRGVDSMLGEAFWGAVCRRMEAAFRAGRFEAGALAAVREITVALAGHFPARGDNPDELPDSPLLL